MLLLHVGVQYSAGAYTGARAEVWSVDGLAPHPASTSLRMSAQPYFLEMVSGRSWI